jgi:S-adenosylmethionine:tRNA ribosyltransferase-isomerase
MGRKTHPSDETRYQTAYAERLGSVAAPTAGLHFTPELLKVLHEARMGPVAVTLHVGIGTFRPVKTQDIRDHEMHEERYELREEVAAKLQSRRKEGGRVIAVGTTTIRTLESAWNQGELRPGRGRTKLFLYPKEDGSPQGLQSCDGMITNFHLPKSTLLMLVASVIGRSEVLRVYEEAIREKYRFYSYGDAMLLLPD